MSQYASVGRVIATESTSWTHWLFLKTEGITITFYSERPKKAIEWSEEEEVKVIQ